MIGVQHGETTNAEPKPSTNAPAGPASTCPRDRQRQVRAGRTIIHPPVTPNATAKTESIAVAFADAAIKTLPGRKSHVCDEQARDKRCDTNTPARTTSPDRSHGHQARRGARTNARDETCKRDEWESGDVVTADHPEAGVQNIDHWTASPIPEL
jgi:hypothetical protein